MPTAHGDFDAVCYTETNSGLEHLVLTGRREGAKHL